MRVLPVALAGFLGLFSGITLAETPVFEINIQDHKFTPDTVTVPAGQKVKLKINNNDPTPEEFESYKLHREKLIPAKSTAYIFIGPLEAGEYKFFGEFHEKTAKGTIIAK